MVPVMHLPTATFGGLNPIRAAIFAPNRHREVPNYAWQSSLSAGLSIEALAKLEALAMEDGEGRTSCHKFRATTRQAGNVSF